MINMWSCKQENLKTKNPVRGIFPFFRLAFAFPFFMPLIITIVVFSCNSIPADIAISSFSQEKVKTKFAQSNIFLLVSKDSYHFLILGEAGKVHIYNTANIQATSSGIAEAQGTLKLIRNLETSPRIYNNNHFPCSYIFILLIVCRTYNKRKFYCCYSNYCSHCCKKYYCTLPTCCMFFLSFMLTPSRSQICYRIT